MPLARSLALRFRGRSEPRDDLVQVAALGLVKAIDRYDPGRGLAFSSYAVPTILGELRRHFRDRTWSVHMPRRLQEQSARISKLSDSLALTLGRQPSVAEVAQMAGMSQEEVLDAVMAASAYRSSSLDQPIPGEDEGRSVGSRLGYDDAGFEEVEARASIAAIAAEQLTERQRRVLWMRVEEDLTQDEIATRVGISQMQVSRDLAAARDALRGSLA